MKSGYSILSYKCKPYSFGTLGRLIHHLTHLVSSVYIHKLQIYTEKRKYTRLFIAIHTAYATRNMASHKRSSLRLITLFIRFQFGETVLLLRHPQVRYFMAVMQTCISGPMVKSMWQKAWTDRPPVSSAYFSATMGVYHGLVRLRKRGLLASITFLVHCKERESGHKTHKICSQIYRIMLLQ